MKLSCEFQDSLQPLIAPQTTAFIGLGNPDRGDDHFGLHLAEILRQIGFPHVFSETDDLATVVLDLRENSSITIIVFLDAVEIGGIPGTPVILERTKFPVLHSSHEVPLGVYASILVVAKKSVYCLGVQAEHLQFQEPMSQSVTDTLNAFRHWFLSVFTRATETR